MKSLSCIICKYLCCFSLFIVTLKADAQCSSSGPNSAINFSSQSFTGSVYAWSNAGNAASSDNNRASASAILSVLNGHTDYLVATDFGFNISSMAGICGIEVRVEKSASNIGGLASIHDYEVKLIKNGAVTGTNNATGADWTSSDNYYTYGSPTDTWGSTWIGSDINANNFGVAISAQINGIIGVFPSSRIDHITITVYYAIVLPVELISFEAKEENTGIVLNWTAGETNDQTRFTVQRSEDGTSWNNIAEVLGELPSTTAPKYQFTDRQPLREAYYRLKINMPQNQTKYSSILRIKMHFLNSFTVFPNPAHGNIVVSTVPGVSAEIKIYSITGNLVMQKHLYSDKEILDLSLIRPGFYFYMILQSMEISKKGAIIIK